MATNPWAPDETSEQLFAENAWLQGALLCAVAYGCELTLFFMCFYLLFKQRKRSASKKRTIGLLIYITFIFILGSLFLASNNEFTQLAFITNRNYPGGPGQFETDMFSIPADEVSNVSFVLSNWSADLLIVWRYMVIYKGSRYPLWAFMALPCTIFAGSFVTGLLWLIQISTSSPYATGVNYTIPFYTLSLALNIIMTLAIVARLLIFRRRIASALGPGHGSQYTSIAAMVVESAAIYSSFSIVFLALFAINNPVSTVFLQSLGEIQICVTLLVVFRVAQGKGWSNQTQTTLLTTGKTAAPVRMNQLSRIRFAGTPTDSTLTAFEKTKNSRVTEVIVDREIVVESEMVEAQNDNSRSMNSV